MIQPKMRVCVGCHVARLKPITVTLSATVRLPIGFYDLMLFIGENGDYQLVV
jgi:hypothetical protein